MQLKAHTTTIAVLLLVLSPTTVRADLRLPAIFADNMVLQRERSNPVWGWSKSGDQVTVQVGEHTVAGKARNDGRWKIVLPKFRPRADAMEIRITTSSGSTRVIRNVLVGDVWFCTGPSNIYWPVKRCDNAEEEIAAANYPKIRFFTVKQHLADEPQDDCVGSWVACGSQSVGDVSGIGYFFARRLHKDQDVPVGVLQSFWGGSRIEAWTSKEALHSQPSLKPIMQWWKEAFAGADSSAAEDPRKSRHRPACLYNGMVAPLIPFGIRGVISYQGLGNLNWAQHGRVLLSTMIKDWRARWDQRELPFGMVQPAPFPCDRWPQQHKDAYSLQRESQILVMNDLPNIGIAPTMDIGDLKELHFTNKQAVARRLANWALATVYDRNVSYAGPIYDSMSVADGKIRIRFQNTAKGLTTSDGQAPSHFTIAGKDGVFHPATAAIEKKSVIVYSDRVTKPVAVRFAWSDTSVPNLINSDGLPASIFRTDTPTIKVDNRVE